jgi:hypothetical protein
MARLNESFGIKRRAPKASLDYTGKALGPAEKNELILCLGLTRLTRLPSRTPEKRLNQPVHLVFLLILLLLLFPSSTYTNPTISNSR